MPRYCLRCERELTVSDGPYGPKCAQILGFNERYEGSDMYGDGDWVVVELPDEPDAMPYYDRNNNLLATDDMTVSKYDSQPPLPGDNEYGLRYGTESSTQSIIIENALRGIESDPKMLATQHPRYHLKDGTPVPPDMVEAYSYYYYMEQIAVLEARIDNLSGRQRGQIDRMSPGSRQFWLESLDVYDGKSRIETYTHPYDLNAKSTPSVSDNFGDDRKKTRSHGGLDIYPAPNRGRKEHVPIYAVTDGEVINVRHFTEGTYEVTVRNVDGSIVRYGELSPSVKVGDPVKRGQEIGKTKLLQESQKTMLHIEFYTGEAGYAVTTREGALSQQSRPPKNLYADDQRRYRNLPYERRIDIVDPSPIGAAKQHPDKPGDIMSGSEIGWVEIRW